MRRPGWYGKLPFLGDFASRRLPGTFVLQWDEWLQRCMAQSRNQLGEGWMEAYLNSPIWRFLIGPGVLGPTSWGGILFPSVDRVGRYFPFTLCADLGHLAQYQGDDLETWLRSLEASTHLALDADTDLEHFDLALPSLPAPQEAKVGEPLAKALHEQRAFIHFEERGADKPPGLLENVQRRLFAACIEGYSLWTCSDSEGSLGGFVCRELPNTELYAKMLDYTPGK